MRPTEWSEETVQVRKDRASRTVDATVRVRTLRYAKDRPGGGESTAPVRRLGDGRTMMIVGAIALLLLSAASGLVLAFVL